MIGVFHKIGQHLPSIAHHHLRDTAGIAAIGSITYGAGLIFEPAGFIVGGAMALVIVVMLARSAE